FDVCVDLFWREERASAESWLAFVIRDRPGGRAGEPAVGRHLSDGADAQPLIAIARFLAEFLQPRRALLRMASRRWIQNRDGGARQLGSVLPVQPFPLCVRPDGRRID